MTVVAELEERVVQIPVSRLLPNRDLNPRKEMREIEDLAASIKLHGVLTPLTVEQFGGNYRIIAGHRRHVAAQRAGLAKVPCIVRRFTEDNRLERMLVDNIQRNDLDPIEEAGAYLKLYDRGLLQKEIARRVGKSEGHISRRLQLLDLPASDRLAIKRGRLTPTEALGYMPSVPKDSGRCRTCGQKLPKESS